MNQKPPPGLARFAKLVERTQLATPRAPAQVRRVDSVEQFGRRAGSADAARRSNQDDRLLGMLLPWWGRRPAGVAVPGDEQDLPAADDPPVEADPSH